jgi:hypothetical protein
MKVPCRCPGECLGGPRSSGHVAVKGIAWLTVGDEELMAMAMVNIWIVRMTVEDGWM